MSSPFPSIIHNATLRFRVRRPAAEVDPITGNPLPQVVVYEYTAFLKEDKSKNNVGQPGVDINTMFVKGYLVDPQHFPPFIRTQSECECEIWRGEETQVKGRLKLRPNTITTRLISQIIGDPLQGILSIED